ncbi:MAG: hypothetical protein SVX43_09295, partial [Cyanobacteriota bacterium]|nr:hypothetical protein [Cyanobacteriota bacterium]
AVGAIGFFGRLGEVGQELPQLGRGTAVDLMTLLAVAVAGWSWGPVAVFSHLVKRGTHRPLALGLVLCSASLGASIGWGAELGFRNPIAIAALLGTGGPLLLLLVYRKFWV